MAAVRREIGAVPQPVTVAAVVAGVTDKNHAMEPVVFDQQLLINPERRIFITDRFHAGSGIV